MTITIDGLFIHPIKSCRGVAVDSATLDRRGMVHDRRWMLVDETGGFRTLRTLPKMALVGVTLPAGAAPDGPLAVTAPDTPALELPGQLAEGTPVHVEVWGDRVDALAHAAGSAWFSEVLGESLRLVYMPDSSERAVRESAEGLPEGAGDIVSFADGYPLLIVSRASVADLSERAGSPMEARRFRPNVIVTGTAPFAEDTWATFEARGVTFDVVSPCVRCVATTVDPESGTVGKEPLKTLASYRRTGGGNSVIFGMNARHRSLGEVRVGDVVTPRLRA